MTLSLASIDPTLLFGAPGGISLLAFVGARFHRLEKEVRQCRERDADMVVLTAGVRMIVGELMRERPSSPALQMFSDLMNRRLGPAVVDDDFASLLKRIDQVDERRKRDEPHA